MRAMRVAALAAVCALAVTGCNGVSQVVATAEVEISGSALRQDGSPAGEATVAMAKELGPAEAFEGLFTVMSFGTVCLVPEPPDLCRERGAYAEVADDGRFVLRVSGRDTQSFFGFASTLHITGALPGQGGLAGPATTLRLAAQAERIELPALRFWQATPAVAAADGALEVQVPQPPADFGAGPVSLEFEGLDGAVVWSQPATGAVTRVDPRLLEDLATGAAAQATGEAVTTNLKVDAIYRTGRVAVRGAGAPPSRGAACTLHDAQGPLAVSPCPITDGDLTTPLQPRRLGPGEPPPPPPPPGSGERESVVLDLGAVAPRSLVVLRGVPSGFSVELSADGAAWSAPVQVQATERAVAVPVGPAPARYVRLSNDPGLATHLTEVSVW